MTGAKCIRQPLESVPCVDARFAATVSSKGSSALATVAITDAGTVKVAREPCIAMAAASKKKPPSMQRNVDDGDTYSRYDFTLLRPFSPREQFQFDMEVDIYVCCLCMRDYNKACVCQFACAICAAVDRATYPSSYHKENRERYATCHKCNTSPICVTCYANKKCNCC